MNPNPDEELSAFCDRLAQLTPEKAQRALGDYFRLVLDSMPVAEIRDARAMMLAEAAEGRERNLFEARLTGMSWPERRRTEIYVTSLDVV